MCWWAEIGNVVHLFTDVVKQKSFLASVRSNVARDEEDMEPFYHIVHSSLMLLALVA